MEVQTSLIEARPSEECGCPEELWMMGSLEVLIHFEADGSGHIIADAGDWQHDFFADCADMSDLRQQAITWVNSLPNEE